MAAHILLRRTTTTGLEWGIAKWVGFANPRLYVVDDRGYEIILGRFDSVEAAERFIKILGGE